MKYMLLMSATKSGFDWYAKWPKKDLQANMAFMRDFSKELRESGEFVATEGLAWPDQAKIVRAYQLAARAFSAPAPEGTQGSMPIEVRPVMCVPSPDLLCA